MASLQKLIRNQSKKKKYLPTTNKNKNKNKNKILIHAFRIYVS